VSPIDEAVQHLHAVDAEFDPDILRTEMLQALRDGLAELPDARRHALVLLASSPGSEQAPCDQSATPSAASGARAAGGSRPRR
jgi:hypothetical protein